MIDGMIDVFKLVCFKIRKAYNKNKKRFIVANILSLLIFLVLCILSDKYIPKNTITMFLFTLESILFAGCIFVFLYTRIQEHRFVLFTNEYKNRFSFNQRVNMSLFLCTIIFSIYLITLNQKSLVYTLSSSVVIFAPLLCFLFIVPSEDEIKRDRYGIEDERDVFNKVIEDEN